MKPLLPAIESGRYEIPAYELRALKKLGPCKAHRLTYAPVSKAAVLR